MLFSLSIKKQAKCAMSTLSLISMSTKEIHFASLQNKKKVVLKGTKMPVYWFSLFQKHPDN